VIVLTVNRYIIICDKIDGGDPVSELGTANVRCDLKLLTSRHLVDTGFASTRIVNRGHRKEEQIIRLYGRYFITNNIDDF